MYSDIIPPKKRLNYSSVEEYNSVRFSAPHQSYTQPKKRKIPFVLLAAACVIIGIVLYHNLSRATVFTITPKTTRFEIKQNIPLILQGREKSSLTYSLVYVPSSSEDGSIRNPFDGSESQNASTSPSAVALKDAVTITATTTGAVKKITIINKTNSSIALRKETRFDVDGVTYILDAAYGNPPTEKKVLDLLSSSTKKYPVIGFKGTQSYDLVYAVPEIIQGTQTDDLSTVTSSTTSAMSTVPPKELLSLMPPRTLALQKSTIYDKIVDQSALVVFDQSALEEFLTVHIDQMTEYYKALKPFGESISYTIAIVDYTLNTSVESGKPTSLSSLSIEVTPNIERDAVPLQFAGFSKDTMDIIEKQATAFIGLRTTYTPFWSKSVAESKKITVKIFSENE